MIDWLAHQKTDGYDYTTFDARIKDNEKAIIREYWEWHDKFAKLSTAQLRKWVTNQVIRNAI
jgi:ribonuclease D